MNKITSKLTASFISLMFLVPVFSFINFGTASADPTGEINSAMEVEDMTTNSGYSTTTSASPGDELQYKIRLWNPLSGTVSNLMAELDLPTGSSSANTATAYFTGTNAEPVSDSSQATVNLSSAQSINFKSGSLEILDSNGNEVSGLSDSVINQYSGGYNIGSLGPSQLEYLQFDATVTSPPAPSPTPEYSCTSLDVEASGNQTVKISGFNETATNGATFTDATIDWGDSSAQLNTASPTGQTHTYSEAGTYTIKATANFTASGQNVSSTNAGCQQIVTITNKPSTPVINTSSTSTPPTTTTSSSTPEPTSLVNTGPGTSAVVIFIVTLVASLFGYRMFAFKKINN